MKPTLHLDVLLRQTDDGYEAHCLQFDLVEVAPTTDEAEQAIKDVITAHIEYSLAHDNAEYLFHLAPQEAWQAFFSSRPYKRVTLELHPKQTASPFPDTIDLQETLLEAA
jgi:predicted RNase H-like HicB family nuclease